MSKNEVEIVIYDEMPEKPEFKFYILNAMNQIVGFKTRDRAKAEARNAEEYGAGKYRLRTTSIEKSSGDVSCRASQSRKGFSYKIKDGQIPRGIK